jgi:monoamine oxidase
VGPRGVSAWGSDRAVGAFWDAGEEQEGRPPLLCVLTGGDLAPPLSRLPSRERIVRVVRGLPRFPRTRVLEAASVAWDREPYVRGGYARFDVGYEPALRDVLEAPLPRIAFAGEHTSQRLQGFVAGAVESGRRAARDVLATLRRPRSASARRATGRS